MSKEIEAAVDALLAEAHVTAATVYVGQVKRDNWDADQWSITFTANMKVNVRSQTTLERFDYFTGLGHRKPAKPLPEYQKRAMGPHEIKAWNERNSKPVKPHPAGVLHSLIMDSRALDTSFPYWCDEYGYDRDSIKALNIYNECCAVGERLYKVLGRELCGKLEEVLQDY